MSDAGCAFGSLLPHALLKRRNFADSLRQVRRRGVQNGDPARVVSAVLKSLQSLEKDLPSRLLPDIGHNPTHTILSFQRPVLSGRALKGGTTRNLCKGRAESTADP